MIPWQLIAEAPIPGSTGRPGQGAEISAGSKLVLYRRGEEYSIRVDNWELMNSRSFGSEEELASVACQRINPEGKARSKHLDLPCLLVGGLGMGFTLRTALDNMPTESRVVVAELVPEVVRWNEDYLGDFAGRPLDDPRVEVALGDVADRIRSHPAAHDAIVLDVDNGPHTRQTKSEGWLYSDPGLDAIHNSLRPAGVLSIWSAGPSPGFTERIAARGYQVEELRCRGRGKKGSRHRIWLAQRSE